MQILPEQPQVGLKVGVPFPFLSSIKRDFSESHKSWNNIFLSNINKTNIFLILMSFDTDLKHFYDFKHTV